MQKLLLLLVVVFAMTSNVALGQQLKYSPSSGISQSSFDKFLDNAKKEKIETFFVTVANNQDESQYVFAIFKKGHKGMTLFDIGSKSYIIGVHDIQSEKKNDFTLYCEALSYPISLDNLEEIFRTNVVPLTEKNLLIWLEILKD